MLRPEEITERIESKTKIKTWVETRMDGLRGLDEQSRCIGRLLLGYSPSGEAKIDEAQAPRRRACGAWQLRKLDEPALLRLGRTLFPQFPDVFEAAWKLHTRLPIQTDPLRKPFRAPDRPDLLRNRRIEFLQHLMDGLEGIDADLPWVAAHAPYLGIYVGLEHVGVLLAAAIDQGGKQADEIRQILRDSAEGTHEVGQMGRHVTAAFLCSGDRDCWEYVEKLLLAAQRQEGLRQAILESVDFSHPQAFRRMLRLVLDNDLTRFSATVRAADVWLDLQLDMQSARFASNTLESVATLLDDEQARARALAGHDPRAAYFALWSIAFDDAPAAVEPASVLLGHKKAETRFAAVQLLGTLGVPEAYEHFVHAAEDPDLRVATLAGFSAGDHLKQRMLKRAAGEEAEREGGMVLPEWMPSGRRAKGEPPADSGDLFERLERLYRRLPVKDKEGRPILWPWMRFPLSRQLVVDAMLSAIGNRPRTAFLPYLSAMTPDSRQRLVELLGEQEMVDAPSRDALLHLVGDASGSVREAAVKVLAKLKITAGDLPSLEPLLARKADDLRRAVLRLILSLNDAEVLACAGRLGNSKAAPARLAGLDLLRQMLEKGRSAERVRAAADAYRERRGRLDRDEEVCLDNLMTAKQAPITLDDALGLMDPTRRTPPTPPARREVKLGTPAAIRLAELVDAAVHEHREDPVILDQSGGDQEAQPLGSTAYPFPSPYIREYATGVCSKRPIEGLPLQEIWLRVWSNRPSTARDSDGLEAARGRLICSLLDSYASDSHAGWQGKVTQELLGKLPRLKYPHLAGKLLLWLVAHETKAALADFSVDGLETLLAAIPRDKLTEELPYGGLAFRQLVHEFDVLTDELRAEAELRQEWSVDHTRRVFGLDRWIDEPLGMPGQTGSLQVPPIVGRKKAASTARDQSSGTVGRQRMPWHNLFAAFEAGWANEHDVYDDLLGPRSSARFSPHGDFVALHTGSAQLRKGELSANVAPLVQRAVDRVLEIELARGETETPASPAALALNYAGGTDVLVRVLQAIGRDPKLQRTHSWGAGSQGKSVVFSHLIRVTMPDKDETPEGFAKAVKTAGIEEDALLAVALYAPQWARFIQAAVEWEMLAEAVWWFHAHTKDNKWRVDREIREAWNAEIRKLTPLTLEELMDGAVDVDWFNRIYAELGKKRWTRLDEFAKYASGGAGHKRAQLFAAAMLNQVSERHLVADIKRTRKQDAVRALGLLPLSAKTRKKAVLDRYKLMQEFVRTCRQFGSQQQASDKLAARIGQENLARTAGYPDPIRLQWAMEGLATADLAKGPVTATVKGVTVQLAIDAEGLPEISVRRGEKPLKNIPPDAKTAKAVQELVERKTELRRSGSRMRQSLELAMCRGDRFGAEEFRELMANPMLRPMLERLVFIGEGVMGYPIDGGKGLRDHSGKVEPLKKSEVLRMVHPVDLLASKAWSKWQRDCFSAERVQPFKQVFRELYVLTDQEKKDRTFSRRYAGQQVNPRQAMALLGSRGWVTAPEAGVFRVFHDEKIVSWIEFMEPFYTPAEVEGLTLEKVRFAKRGADEYLKLIDVPPRLLSETLRDVDLIVSVAHRGGVDPEASASTVELRSTLLRETILLLRLANVRIRDTHVHVRGTHAEYSVHLGSGTTHMLPGGALFIVPIHSQHRGRIFLPFADDDPKTAEILSKVLLLSRDNEIQDPNLLDQIRSRQ